MSLSRLFYLLFRKKDHLMPQGTDMTIKKNDGTTDITYTFVQPSSGEGVPAVFKSQSVGTAASHQPEFRLSAKDGGVAGERRNLRATFQYPETATDTTTGLTSVVRKASFNADGLIPKDMSQAAVNEAVAQFANLLKHALMQSCLKSGYSAS